jgi:hypothetical protein
MMGMRLVRGDLASLTAIGLGTLASFGVSAALHAHHPRGHQRHVYESRGFGIDRRARFEAESGAQVHIHNGDVHVQVESPQIDAAQMESELQKLLETDIDVSDPSVRGLMESFGVEITPDGTVQQSDEGGYARGHESIPVMPRRGGR